MVLRMSNPFRVANLAKQGKPTRYYSDIQEKAVAKEIGGKQTKNKYNYNLEIISVDKFNDVIEYLKNYKK